MEELTVSITHISENAGETERQSVESSEMAVAGERLTLDFSRSSPQCQGPVNISRATAVADVRDPFGNRLDLIQNPHFDPKAVR